MARATRIIKRVNREPLTKKALGAIETYVYLNGDAFAIISLGVRWTLEAERMPRERLYKWLGAMETQERYAMNLDILITNAMNAQAERMARVKAAQEAEQRRQQQSHLEDLRERMRIWLPDLLATNPEFVWSNTPSPYAMWTKVSVWDNEVLEVHLWADTGGRGDLHWIVSGGGNQDIHRAKGTENLQDQVTVSIAKRLGYEVPDGL